MCPRISAQNYRVAVIDANHIAREVLGVPIVNTTMLGALIKASGVIKLESIAEPLKHRFGKLAEKNLAAMKRAYDETQVKEMVPMPKPENELTWKDLEIGCIVTDARQRRGLPHRRLALPEARVRFQPLHQVRHVPDVLPGGLRQTERRGLF